jgi:hypothetical protein
MQQIVVFDLSARRRSFIEEAQRRACAADMAATTYASQPYFAAAMDVSTKPCYAARRQTHKLRHFVPAPPTQRIGGA